MRKVDLVVWDVVMVNSIVFKSCLIILKPP